MRINKRIAVAGSVVSIIVVAAAPTFHRTRPSVRCDIPARDYQHIKLSQPARSLSNVAVVIDPRLALTPSRDVNNRVGPAHADRLQAKVKSFQFVKDPTLQIDHCSLADMSVLLDETGKWTVSLRANQNPLNPVNPLDVTTLEPKRLFTDHLQRNKFHITVNCYAQYGSVAGERLLGQPLVIPLTVKPFWVQRQQPYSLFETDYSPEVQRHFDSIDRVEIEFAYQLD